MRRFSCAKFIYVMSTVSSFFASLDIIPPLNLLPPCIFGVIESSSFKRCGAAEFFLVGVNGFERLVDNICFSSPWLTLESEPPS